MPKIPKFFHFQHFQGKLVIKVIKIDLLTSLGMFLGLDWKKAVFSGFFMRGKDAYKTHKTSNFPIFSFLRAVDYPG